MTRVLALAFLPLLTLSSLARQVRSHQQAQQVPNQPANAKASSGLAPSQIFNRARPAVVVIVAADQNSQRQALGSGFLVSRDQIATNHHVVEGMKEAFVLFSDGATKRVSGVVADSVQQDLIILRVETGNRTALPFGDELSLKQGDPVYALGAPKGLELSFTNGIVSSFRKSDAQFLIQTTAPIAPGSSGGPLFDRAGRVVGVTTSMISDAPGIYFSVGIGDLRRLMRTPQGVVLSFEEWANQQEARPRSESASKSAPSQGPSFQETISWMQDFSKVHGIRMVDGRITAENFLLATPQDGCTVLLMQSYPYTDNSSRPGTLYNRFSRLRVNLSDIAPETVKPDAYGNVQLQSTDPSGKIVEVKSLVGGGEIEGLLETAFIVFDSIESSQRFASAIKHAVILCGGVNGPY